MCISEEMEQPYLDNLRLCVQGDRETDVSEIANTEVMWCFMQFEKKSNLTVYGWKLYLVRERGGGGGGVAEKFRV